MREWFLARGSEERVHLFFVDGAVRVVELGLDGVVFARALRLGNQVDPCVCAWVYIAFRHPNRAPLFPQPHVAVQVCELRFVREVQLCQVLEVDALLTLSLGGLAEGFEDLKQCGHDVGGQIFISGHILPAAHILPA
jgi:hypothetical protein